MKPRLWSQTGGFGSVWMWMLAAVILVGGPVSCASSQEVTGEGAASVWTCAMHPSVRLDAPGACPLCGMDLVEASGQGRQLGRWS